MVVMADTEVMVVTMVAVTHLTPQKQVAQKLEQNLVPKELQIQLNQDTTVQHRILVPHSVLHGGGKSAFARNAMRASSNATPMSSWKSLHTETKTFTDATNDIPPLYRGNSTTNYLLYQSLFHPRHHYVPQEQKPEDLQKEEDKKNIKNILLMIGGTILVAVILVGILMLFF